MSIDNFNDKYYKEGFVTDLENETFPKGLNEKIIENINHKNIHLDMTDFPGFNYHQGLVFSVHTKNFGFAIANGGQYSYQKVNGEKRSAIGFDIDLISLLTIKENIQ